MSCVKIAQTNKKILPKPRLSNTSKRAGETEPLKSDRGLFYRPASRIPRPTTSTDRNKKIAEIERQLSIIEEEAVDKALTNEDQYLSEEEDSQTNRNLSTMVEKKQMIGPGSRDAPKFLSSRPRELRRFIRQLEDLWKEAGIEKDEEKKESLGKYADQESEEEWKALDTYGAGYTWEEFKQEILENYPEAAAAERGTPARIRQIVRDADGIEMGDSSKLYAYRRAFLAEANKLMKPPQVMSNRELVELFMGGLSLSLGQAVLQYLGGMRRSSKEKEKGKETAPEVVRRPEDRYDLEEVCRVASEVVENATGMLSYKWSSSQGAKRGSSLVQSTTSSESSNLVNKLESIEQSQALEKDRLDVVHKQLGARFDAMEGLMKSLLQSQEKTASSFVQNVGQGGGGHSHSEPMANRGYKNFSNATDMTCFGCGLPGHFQNNCERVKNMIQNGVIVYNREGRVCLPDGSRVPNIPAGASLLERVDRYYGTLRSTQAYYGTFEEMEEKMGGVVPRESSSATRDVEDREQKLVRLEKELDLKERESALVARQLKLEVKSPDKGDLRSYLLERFEEELKTGKDDKAGFL